MVRRADEILKCIIMVGLCDVQMFFGRRLFSWGLQSKG